ncbi:hypothetical protein GCM10025870_13230 [Agromyces marinus]|uniref:Uncharacterized protein n=1 Tax=Agromyces marinus TaxID=1389020 RepID=A0ABN6YA88_9MICO|nr:hypothetical protein GCM10025870_13230 [Agromyces marinus]
MDRAHRERALDRHERAPAGVGGLELEAHETVRDRAGAGAAVPGEVHAEEPEFSGLAHELAAEVLVLEVLLDDGRDALLREPARAVAPRELVLGEECVEVEHGVDPGCDGHGGPFVGFRGRAQSRGSQSAPSSAPSAGGALR